MKMMQIKRKMMQAKKAIFDPQNEDDADKDEDEDEEDGWNEDS